MSTFPSLFLCQHTYPSASTPSASTPTVLTEGSGSQLRDTHSGSILFLAAGILNYRKNGGGEGVGFREGKGVEEGVGKSLGYEERGKGGRLQ